MRNESEIGEIPQGCTIDRSGLIFMIDLSMSIFAGTRKMVNYA
jgi:hypothetical protein